MTKQTEALRMAIEWLDNQQLGYNGHSVRKACQEALENLEKDTQISRKEEALNEMVRLGQEMGAYNIKQPTAEQSSLVQKPVAWMNDIAFSMDKELLGTRSRIVPLYTTPPSREWVGLSDRELFNLSQQCNLNHILGLIDYGRAIEAKLREKNELSVNSR